MEESTLKASGELVRTCMQQIRVHLAESKKNSPSYDWYNEIMDAVEIADTEAESWCRENKKVKKE